MRVRLALFCALTIVCLVTANVPKDPYDALGLKKGADIKDVKKAYKNLARTW